MWPLCKSTDNESHSRPTRSCRRAFTLLELMIAMTVMLMVIGALAGLARTVEQGYEYSEGYGIATQQARITLDRIAQNVCQATANEQFPGCLVVAETVNGYRYPDALVLWRPGGDASSPTGLGRTPANPSGLPCFNELLIYCPDPNAPNQFVELTAPGDARTVPAANDDAGWQSALAALKKNAGTRSVLLTDLLRTCSTSGAGNLRGAVRFETRLLPSAGDWASFKAGSAKWMDLPWTQNIYGPQAGLRQVWVRTELQLMPGVAWIESNKAAAEAVPYLGSAALYYQLTHP
ncbi:MAG: prepilin-type N-terminal cleavage/methylation domain-containing protein [Thermoguttaceae bacterium]